MKIALGTVQFGINYGISNKKGQTQTNEIKKIFKIAHKEKIKIIDTAPCYGDSEIKIGSCIKPNHKFKIITKTPYFQKKIITNKDINLLEQSIYKSLENTKQKKLYGILFHNTNDIFCKNGDFLLKKLQELKKQKIIETIGFSIYTKEQIDKLLQNFDFDLIQIPINILDQKLLHEKYLTKLKNKKIKIHARSIFLQGLLLLNPNKLNPFFGPVKNILLKYHQELNYLKIRPIEAAINFIKKIKEIDHIIIGLNNSKQLIKNINAYNKKLPRIDYSKYICLDEKITNPSKWEIKK